MGDGDAGKLRKRNTPGRKSELNEKDVMNVTEQEDWRAKEESRKRERRGNK